MQLSRHIASFSNSRARAHLVGFSNVPTAGVINAELRTFNTTGSGLITSGVPLPKGTVTHQQIINRQVRVELLDGTELPIYCEALKGGWHGDNSPRSMLIQLNHNLPNQTPIPVRIRIGQTRQTSDLAKTTVGDTEITSGRVILVTDGDFVRNSWVTFQPILAASSENSNNSAFFNNLFDSKYEQIVPGTNPPTPLKDFELTAGNHSATYENVRALLARWQATLNPKYYWNGVQRGYYQLRNFSLQDVANTDINPHVNNAPAMQTDGNNGTGQPAEWNSQRFIGMASMYLLTGCEKFHRVISMTREWGTALANTQLIARDRWVHNNFIGRFNLIQQWPFMVTTAIDSTLVFNAPIGWGNGRVITDYPTEIDWMRDSWDFHVYNDGNWWDGIRGNRHTATNNGGGPAGHIPNFQLALCTDAFRFYYYNVKADPNVALYIKSNTDLVLDNLLIPLQSGDGGFGFTTHGMPYLIYPTKAQRSGSEYGGWGTHSWTDPMWAPSIAFCKAVFGDSKYDNYYSHCTEVGTVENGLIWEWKIFGEIYGNTMDSAYLNQMGLPSGLPSAIRSPVQH